MDWLHATLAGLSVVTGFLAWHYRDLWRAAEGRVGYWSAQHDRTQRDLNSVRSAYLRAVRGVTKGEGK